MVDSADQARKVATQRYQDQIIPPGGMITNPTTSGINYKDGLNITNQYARTLYDMSIPERKSIAQSLKNAGYKVATTGGYSRKLVSAYSSAIQASQFDAADLGQEFDSKFFASFLIREAADRIAQGAGDGGPKVRKDIRIADETTARTLINRVLQDAIGRGATKEELKKYTSALQKAQKASPLVTTYSTSGDIQTATTTGGINEEQFLIQQIAGTDEAKANKVFSYYNAFKDALGVR